MTIGSQKAYDQMTIPSADAALIEQLRERLEKAVAPFRDGKAYALLDFPAYSNVGDSVLWLGARALLERVTGRAPVYVSSQASHDDDELARALPEGTIYILGGGNFGDLYPPHQLFRERLMARFPAHPIVQLPQSVEFRTDAARERTSDALRAHGHFVMMVRDQQSLVRAETLGAQAVILAPDLAFAKGVQRAPHAPKFDVVALRRTDSEAGSDAQLFSRAFDRTVDWVDFDTSVRRIRAVMRISKRKRIWQKIPRALRLRLFDMVARARAQHGYGLLADGALVVTDRLHAHIMCLLMGRPHELVNDGNGKIRAMVEQWTNSATTLRRVSWEAEGRATRGS